MTDDLVQAPTYRNVTDQNFASELSREHQSPKRIPKFPSTLTGIQGKEFKSLSAIHLHLFSIRGMAPLAQPGHCGTTSMLSENELTSSCSPSYISQLYGDPIPCVETDSGVYTKPSDFSTSLTRASDTLSMSRRRQACNRPTLDLRLAIPPPAVFPSLSCTGARQSTSGTIAPNHSAASFQILPIPNPERSSNPRTPIDQCYKSLVASPKAPRRIGSHHNRWIPTPTEGVLPAVLAATNPQISISDSASDCNHAQSNAINIGQLTRPKLSGRSLSWLSTPRTFKEPGITFALLASPFFVSEQSGPNDASSPLTLCEEMAHEAEPK